MIMPSVEHTLSTSPKLSQVTRTVSRRRDEVACDARQHSANPDAARVKARVLLTVRTEPDDVDGGGVSGECREVFDAWRPRRRGVGRALDQGGREDIGVHHP